MSCTVVRSMPTPSKKKNQRLRTGCWTCRRRGYKCDEGRPACHNCTRLNLYCEGYGVRLKWPGDPRGSRRQTDHSTVATSLADTNSRIRLKEVLSDELVSGIEPELQRVFEIRLGSVSGPPIFSADNQMPQVPSDDMFGTHSSSGASSPESTGYNHTNNSNSQDLSQQSFVGYGSRVSSAGFAESLSAHSLPTTAETATTISTAPTTTSSSISSACSGTLFKDFQFVYKGPNDFQENQDFQHAKQQYYGSSEDYSLNVKVEEPSSTQFIESTSQAAEPVDENSLSNMLLLAGSAANGLEFATWRTHVGNATRNIMMAGVVGDNGQCYDINIHHNLAKLNPRLRSLIEQLEYQDVMGSALSEDGPMMSQRFRTMTADTLFSSGFNDGTFSTFTAALYRVVGAISTLSADIRRTYNLYQDPETVPGPFAIPEGGKNNDEFASRRYQIQTAIEALSADPKLMTSNMYTTALLLRNTCILHYYLRLDPAQVDLANSPLINDLVQTGLDLLDEIPNRSGLNVLLEWPIWVMGVLTTTSQSRQFALIRRLQNIRIQLHKTPARTIEQFLGLYWELCFSMTMKRRDLINIALSQCQPPIILV